jgi:hypothetical protein
MKNIEVQVGDIYTMGATGLRTILEITEEKVLVLYQGTGEPTKEWTCKKSMITLIYPDGYTKVR